MILGVTLARGGSKGIPRKNIAPCFGKPLIAWTIEAALRTSILTDYIVCTEDKEIASIAVGYGAKVLMRPHELAEDGANRWEVIKWVLTQIPFDTIVLLQPTSPIRGESLIGKCVMEFINKGASHLVTGYWFHDGAYSVICGRNRQQIQPIFIDDGNVYIWRKESVEDDSPLAGKVVYKENSRRENVDINDDFDLWVAEKVLEDSIRKTE